MRNPWLDVPSSAPFVLPSDAAAIERFNADAGADAFIHLECLPEPFLGDPLAPVVLLALNPGFTAEDSGLHAQSEFDALSRANLEHQKSDFPFYLLNPAAPGLAPPTSSEVPSPGTPWSS